MLERAAIAVWSLLRSQLRSLLFSARFGTYRAAKSAVSLWQVAKRLENFPIQVRVMFMYETAPELAGRSLVRNVR